MPLDSDLLFELVKTRNNEPCVMKVGPESYEASSLELDYSEVPLTKPSTRGGVYFSDKMVFKAKVSIPNVGVAKALSKTMLGPNQEFEKIQLVVDMKPDNGKKTLTLYGNLINYVQKKSGLELNLVIVDTELTD